MWAKQLTLLKQYFVISLIYSISIVAFKINPRSQDFTKPCFQMARAAQVSEAGEETQIIRKLCHQVNIDMINDHWIIAENPFYICFLFQ